MESRQAYVLFNVVEQNCLRLMSLPLCLIISASSRLSALFTARFILCICRWPLKPSTKTMLSSTANRCDDNVGFG